MADNEGPIRPEPKPVSLERNSTGILVLDLSKRCHDPKISCFQLLEPVGEFLHRARTYGIPIIYSISLIEKGTPSGDVASPLKRRETEPVINPDGFDKFTGGLLQDFLKQNNIKSLVIIGSATNFAVLYTATTATRIYRYNVILPIDGVSARNKYEQEYALHQLAVLPPVVTIPIQFTNLSLISFI